MQLTLNLPFGSVAFSLLRFFVLIRDKISELAIYRKRYAVGPGFESLEVHHLFLDSSVGRAHDC